MGIGVSIATWPLHSDQLGYSALTTKVLKIGMEVKRQSRVNELVGSSRVEKVVRILIGLEEGDRLRKRAVELGERVKSSLRKISIQLDDGCLC
ncbi:trans-zeatin O-beta-D-glucosyltransferase [Handroanthus impetiginosus]|uniref:Trans-zeatin O-beta-D-glucosyltransferase n=1 Tax=Handroanthus impetiginosus TaxID=429701 RepID=A0A2G9HEW5_9LAMI|nr:trans-zeatin O-beta-D-glucosyltransferase [Handroanthus impetiginosus]